MDLQKRLEGDPLNCALWNELLEGAKARGDFLALKTLPVVVAGLEELVKKFKAPSDGAGIPLSALLTGMQKAAFRRLTSSFNNPKMLREIGLLYVSEFRLPQTGLAHLERAKELNSGDKEIEALIEQAHRAIERERSREAEARDDSGVEKAEHAKKKVASLIRKTGKVALKSQHLAEAVTAGKVETEPAGQTAPPAPRPVTKPLPSGTLPEDDDKAVEYAAGLVRDGHAKHGLEAAEKLHGRLPDDEARFGLWSEVGLACFQKHLFPEALAAYRKANELMPDVLMSWFNMGLALQLNGQLDDALKAYMYGDSLEANHPKVWCNIGALHFQKDDFSAAEAALRKAVEARPSYARAWDNLAAALGAQEKLLESRYACQRAISLRPEFPEAWFKIGTIHLHFNELGEAQEAFSRALSHTALAPFALNSLSIIATRQNRLEDAHRLARDASELEPSNELSGSAWTELGEAYLREDVPAAALEALRQATQVAPDSFEAWYNLGRACQRAERLHEAREAFQHAVQLDDRSFGAYDRLGRIALQLEDAELASACFERLVEIDPQNPESWETLAEACERTGNKARAKEATTRAANLGGRTGRVASKLTGALGKLRSLNQ